MKIFAFASSKWKSINRHFNSKRIVSFFLSEASSNFLAWLQQHSHCLFRSTFVFFLIQNNLFGMIFVFYHVVLPIQFECIHVGFLFHLFFFQQSLMRIQFLPFVSAHLVTICGGIRIPSINSTAVYRCIDKRERKAKSHTSIACISLSMMFYSRLN